MFPSFQIFAEPEAPRFRPPRFPAPRYDGFAQGRSLRRAVGELVLSTIAFFAIVALLSLIRAHLGLG